MKQIALVVLFLFLITPLLYADDAVGDPVFGDKGVEFSEEDGTNANTYDLIKFTNGTTTDNGDLSLSVNTGSGSGSSLWTDAGTEIYPTNGEDVEVRGTSPAYYLNPTLGDTWHIYAGAESYMAFSNYTDGIENMTLLNGGDVLFGYNAEIRGNLNTVGNIQGGNLFSNGTANISGDTTIDGAATLSSTLGVTGLSTLNNLTVSSGSTISMESNLITNVLDPVSVQDAATKEYVDTSIAGIEFDFFLSDTADGAFSVMFPQTTGEAQSTDSATITSAVAPGTLIEDYITEASQPTFLILTEGVYTFHFHAEVDATTGRDKAKILFELYVADSVGGSQVLLMTSETSAQLTTSDVEYDVHAVLADETLIGATDRLVLKAYGILVAATGQTDPVATITMEGTGVNTTATRLAVKTNLTAFDDRYVEVAGDTMTGALTLGGILSDADDMVFEIDLDNDGSNKYSFTDGASAEQMSLTEAGLLTVKALTATEAVILGDGGDNFSVASDGIDIDTSGNITNAGNITLSGASILADAGASGIITLGGTGGTNNENLTVDFETDGNQIALGSGTGVLFVKYSGFALVALDDTALSFGASPDISIVFETEGNDNLQVGTRVGAGIHSGYINIMEQADMGNANRSPTAAWPAGATSANSVLGILSSDATIAADGGFLWHDQDNFNIASGTGDIILNAVGDDYLFGVAAGTDPQKAHIFDGGADNEPGALVLYADDGADYFLWVDTDGELRGHTSYPTDDDADGVVIADLSP